MPFSYAQYAGNGSTTTFSVPFPYLLKAHVKLYTGYNILDGTFASQLVDGTDYTWTSGTQVQATVAPANGVTLTILRDTPDSSQLVPWQDGSNLIADDLNNADLQNLYVVQEQQDRNDAVAAQQASTTALANATAAAVANVLLYETVANVAAIPAAPANGARLEVLNSAGIEGFAPLAGIPAGFVGGSQLKVRMTYTTSGATWNWVDYVAGDPDGRYVRQSAISSSVSSTSTTSVANSAAVKTANDAAAAAQVDATQALSDAAAAQVDATQALSDAAAALPLTGGTLTGNLNVPSLNGGPLAGTRNRIINGNFDIWQRGTSTGAWVAPINNYYFPDRWVFQSSGTGGNGSVSQQAFTPGQTDVPGEPTYFMRWQITAAASGQTTGGSYVEQRIEDVRTLAGQTATISFYAKGTGTLPNIYLTQTFGSGGSAQVLYTLASNVALNAGWTKYTYTVNVGSISGKTIGTNHYVGLTFMVPINSTYTFDLAQVQVEPGTVATPFERRSYGQELALCERYYQVNQTESYIYYPGSATLYGPAPFRTKMRNTPSSMSVIAVSHYGSGFSTSTTTVNENGGRINYPSSSAGYSGAQVTYDATAEL